MKRFNLILFAAILLFAAFSAAGCGKSTTVEWVGYCESKVSEMDKDSCALECTAFDGSATYTINVEDAGGAQLFIKGEVTAYSGELNVTVIDSDENIKYFNIISENEFVSIMLPDPGVYRIRIEASEFSGKYNFRWNF